MDTVNDASSNGSKVSGSTISYSYYCANRLPCGVCRLTMAACPINGWQYGYGITCATTTHNNSTEGSIK